MDPAVLERLAHVPQEEYARLALKIKAKDRRIIPLDCDARPGQRKLADAISRQQAAGKPVRIVLVKSRRFGGSTWVQGEMIKRATTSEHRRILTVAHRRDTAEGLFAMGLLMWRNLPDAMRPPMGGFVNPTLGQKVMHLGEKLGGVFGWPDSRLMIDTAEEVGAGRGLEYTDIHFSEAAFYRDAEKKADDLMSTVPDLPDTSIFIESTGQGLNWFYQRAKAAAGGMSEYELVFVGWHEDPDCTRPFATPEEREAFIKTIGKGDALGDLAAIADDEPWLVEEFGCTPEQLHWRRKAIVDKSGGKVEAFKVEYPATWLEAFQGSGRQVFSVVFTARASKEAEDWSQRPAEEGGPQKGLFVGSDPVTRVLSDGSVEVPSKVVWLPEADLGPGVEWWPGRNFDPQDPMWTLWLPRERTAEEWRQAHDAGEADLAEMEAGIERAARGPGQFIVAGDAADDTYNDVPSQMAESAWNTLVAIDHWTGAQVGEWRGRVDHDLVACHAFLAGMFFGWAWLSIERTGGYGGVILDRLQRRFYYPAGRMYREKVLDDRKRREINRYGWDTNRRTKPQMEATAQALLREGTHGIRSPQLAAEFATYVKDEKNPTRHEPSPGAFSDLLMAWMQAQMIRNLKPVLHRSSAESQGRRPNSMTRKIRY